jgi:hypothetical protein
VDLPSRPTVQNQGRAILDLYEGRWEGERLHAGEYVACCDEKPSIQAARASTQPKPLELAPARTPRCSVNPTVAESSAPMSSDQAVDIGRELRVEALDRALQPLAQRHRGLVSQLPAGKREIRERMLDIAWTAGRIDRLDR